MSRNIQISREYNIKYDELLSIKELCEELITDIIGNIYISNDNRVKYINMLKDYLNEKNNLQENILSNKQEDGNTKKKKRMLNNYFEILFSIILSVIAFIGVHLTTLNTTENQLNKSPNINSDLIAAISTVLIVIVIVFVLPEIKIIIKWFKIHKK